MVPGCTQGVSFFGKGYEYKLWGIIPTNRHILGMKDETKDPNAWIHLFGTDKQGRDVYSRTMHATRVSLTIGLVGVALSIVFGIFVGAISGYYGGQVDNLLMRFTEFFQTIPSFVFAIQISLYVDMLLTVFNLNTLSLFNTSLIYNHRHG